MMLYSEEYKQMQEQFHVERPDYGTSSSRHVDFVLHTAQMMQTQDVLDWGCGKAMLQKGLPFPIQNYDPFIPEYSKRPNPARLVICSDVLEHIEPDCLDAVLDDLKSLSKELLYVVVATRPAGKILPDGRNAHLIIENSHWWLPKLLSRWELMSFQAFKGEFAALLAPPVEKVEE